MSFYHWGFTHIDIDKDRLANGEFVIRECSGVLPDGTPFELSASLGNIPDSRNIANYPNFSPNKRALGVYLAIPVVRMEGANVRLRDSNPHRVTRYIAQGASVKDDNTGENEQQVDVAALNVQLLLEGESFQGYSLLQIAEVVRSAADTFELQPSFVPPTLYTGASEYLKDLASRILQNLITHRTRMSSRASGIFAQRETTPQDVLILGKVGVINANIPVLKHFFEEPSSTPESLYLALASLAGQLYTYVPGATVEPEQYPRYTHDNLGATFTRLETILAELIREQAPDPIWKAIAWAEVKGNMYTAGLEESLLVDRRFFIKVKSSHIPEHRLINEFPASVRIASPGAINSVITAAVPALELNHTSRLPASVPVDDSASYFELLRKGPYWEDIINEQMVAIFMPYHRSQVDIELMGVKG